MDLQQARMLRDVLSDTAWWDRTRAFGRALRTSTRTPGGLLLIGPPTAEPWHLTAHLDDEARFAGLPEMSPTLVRWDPPRGAPSQLAVGLERLSTARRGESVLVVAETAPAALLERVHDVRRGGATIFALDTGHTELAGIAHEVLSVDTGVVPAGTPARTDPLVEHPTAGPAISFEGAQHLLSLAAAEAEPGTPKGLRSRLARLLDTISGPDA
ncbi:hypothetical protein [Actinopolymorpha pittospori]